MNHPTMSTEIEVHKGAKMESPESASLSNFLLSTPSNSDEIEQKIWDVVKQMPGLNVGYGSVRLVIYIGKGNREESWKSAAGVVKGLIQTAAIAGSVFIAPIVTPIAAGALTGVVSESINGVAQIIVFIIEHPDEFLGEKGADQKEKLIYHEIKGIPAIGTAYSAARTPVYLMKGNADEAKISGINSIFEGANTAASCGVGMLTMVDVKTQKLIQKVSKSIIQIVSRKVLEKVAAKEMTLVEGIGVVEGVEVKCEALANPNLGGESQSGCYKESEGMVLQLYPSEIENIKLLPQKLMVEESNSEINLTQKPVKERQWLLRNALEKFLMLCSTDLTKKTVSKLECDSKIVKDFDLISSEIDTNPDILSVEGSLANAWSAGQDPIIIVI